MEETSKAPELRIIGKTSDGEHHVLAKGTSEGRNTLIKRLGFESIRENPLFAKHLYQMKNDCWKLVDADGGGSFLFVPVSGGETVDEILEIAANSNKP